MDFYTLAPANYDDYRSFLKARFEERKRAGRGFSLQTCARTSGISKSHLHTLFHRKRHLTLDKVPAIAKALKITKEEEAFVYLQICLNSSRNPITRKHFDNLLGRLRMSSIRSEVPFEVPKASDTHGKLYRNFLALSLNALVRVTDFQDDPEWIRERLRIPGITAERIRATLTEMESSGALARDDAGRLRPQGDGFWEANPLEETFYAAAHRGATAVAEILALNGDLPPCSYGQHSLALDADKLKELERLMVDTHHRIYALAEQSVAPAATVYVGNFFMTLSRQPGTYKTTKA